jgi:hypothetical protein
MPPSNSSSPKQQMGEPRKIIGATPKFYIRDKGTDYDTGEDFNGLWSGGTLEAPTGYGSIGHWKFNEESGIVGFNNRIRGQFNLLGSGIRRGSDGNGGFFSYNLIKDTPQGSGGSQVYYAMLGTGGSWIESTQFDQYLTTPGFGSLTYDNSAGIGDMRYFFDIWAYLYHAPTAGLEQTILELYHNASTTYGRVCRFFIRNNGGTIELCLEWGNGYAATRSGVTVVASSTAGAQLYPRGLTEDGGLHHIAFVVDRTRLTGFNDIIFAQDDEYPENFYVDGNPYYATSGNTDTWAALSPQDIDTNAFIGCNVVDPTTPFVAAKGGNGKPFFENHLQGKIYSMQMSHLDVIGEVTPERVKAVYGLRFDIPRGPNNVDFSDRFTQEGKHLLQTVSALKQALELDEGSFFITVQDIRMKNG